MPSLNLQTLIGRNPSRPSLKDRAATLKAGLARFGRRKPDVGVALSASNLSALDDSALFTLEAEFRAADAAAVAAYKAMDEARDRYAEPAMPIELNCWRGDWMYSAIPRSRTEEVGGGKFRSLPYGPIEVEEMRGRRCLRQTYDDDGELQPDGRRMVPDTKMQERVDGIVAAWDQWKDAIDAANDQAGVYKAHDAWLRADEERTAILGRIRDTPARTLAGLGAKARIAASVNGVEDMKEEAREYDPDQPLALPYDIAGDVLGILAGGEFASPDAELLDLGRQFEDARLHESAMHRAAGKCEERAEARWPERPACLTFTEEDHALRLRQIHSHPSCMAGSLVTEDDIRWMGRAPLIHAVLRPVRDGERAWHDFPGQVMEHAPWPEAQARADEILAAWAEWHAAIDQVLNEEGVPEAETAAEDASEETAALAGRIADARAATVEGMRVKLQAMSFYRPHLPDDEDHPSDTLIWSLYRDAGVKVGHH